MRKIFVLLALALLAPLFSVATATATSPLTCANPITIKGKEGGHQFPPYLVQQDVWSGEGKQVMHACGANNWEADVTQHGKPETGVKTYPDSGKTYTDWSSCKSQPALSSFATQTTTYGEQAPPADAKHASWDAAYDIFINGSVCHKPLTELMIWNQFQGISVPNAQLHPTIDGIAYDVFHSNGYIQMRMVNQNASGSVNLLNVYSYLEGQGLLSPSDTLAFVQYGFEVLTTYKVQMPFYLTDFSVTDK